MNGEEVGRLQTTAESLRARLREVESEIKRAIESHPRASKSFKRELANVASRTRLDLGKIALIRERARELGDMIPTLYTRRKEMAFRGYAKPFYVRILRNLGALEILLDVD